jgi:16S rRNA (guanine527-N7)-methyltransferase
LRPQAVVLNQLSLGQVADKAAALERYAALIRAENERAGLVSRGDLAAIERRHLAESFALLEALEKRDLLRAPAIDIGSGAGFPGVPIKIIRPDLQIAFLEANQKKAAFLEQVVMELGFADARVLAMRAEDAGRDEEHREAYALAFARAVAPLAVLMELALPLLAVGGTLAAPKGSAAGRELAEAENALQVLGGEVIDTLPLAVEGRGPAPTLVLIRKSSRTPERYPRRAGIPRKRPL